MLALYVPNIKIFMNRLLVEDAFDDFFLHSFEVVSFATLSLMGRRHPTWKKEEGSKECIVWKKGKDFISSFLKGEKAPAFMKAVFEASETLKNEFLSETEAVLQDGSEVKLFFNLKYEKGELSLTTGLSSSDFLNSKELAFLWDKKFMQFLKNNEIEVEEE